MTKIELCKKYGAKYWEKGDLKRYYFNIVTVEKVLSEIKALSSERIEYLKKQFIVGVKPLEPTKLYYSIEKDKIYDKNCPEVAAVIENHFIYKVNGLDDEQNYKDGVLKELLDDD